MNPGSWIRGLWRNNQHITVGEVFIPGPEPLSSWQGFKNAGQKWRETNADHKAGYFWVEKPLPLRERRMDTYYVIDPIKINHSSDMGYGYPVDSLFSMGPYNVIWREMQPILYNWLLSVTATREFCTCLFNNLGDRWIQCRNNFPNGIEL